MRHPQLFERTFDLLPASWQTRCRCFVLHITRDCCMVKWHLAWLVFAGLGGCCDVYCVSRSVPLGRASGGRCPRTPRRLSPLPFGRRRGVSPHTRGTLGYGYGYGAHSKTRTILPTVSPERSRSVACWKLVTSSWESMTGAMSPRVTAGRT